MKKANRAAASEWQAEQRQQAEQRAALEQNREALWYAAEKRNAYNFPCPSVFRAAGLVEVAQLIDEAYAKLQEAYRLLPDDPDGSD